MTRKVCEVDGKNGLDGGPKLQARSGKWLEANKRVRASPESKRLRYSPSLLQTLPGFQRLSVGYASGLPLPRIAEAALKMDDRNDRRERRSVCSVMLFFQLAQ